MSEIPVRVDVDRSGGFAGLTIHSEVDTAVLPPSEADELRHLVDDLDVPAIARRLSEAANRPTRGADFFQYDVTVQAGPRRYRFTVHDGAIPPEVRPLLTYVTRQASRGPQSGHGNARD